MLQYIMAFFSKIYKSFIIKIPATQTTGPNTLQELLEQFNSPPKEKTMDDIVRDYTIKEMMAAYEVEFLSSSPTKMYLGSWRINNDNGTAVIDFVPVAIRPEVQYCSYGKN